MLVAHQPDSQQLEAWRRGVVLEEGKRTQPAGVRVEQPYGKGAWLRVVMRAGRKRQIVFQPRQTGRLQLSLEKDMDLFFR